MRKTWIYTAWRGLSPWFGAAVALLVLLAAAVAGATAPPPDLPRTGQVWSYDANTPQRDDGALQAGAVWPETRFLNPDGTSPVNGDIVLDKLTGLQWTKDANAPGPTACGPGTTKTWQGALDYVTCLNTNSYLNHNDWRVPNINELESLVDLSESSPALPAGHPFSNVQSSYYWSSSTSASVVSHKRLELFFFVLRERGNVQLG